MGIVLDAVGCGLFEGLMVEGLAASPLPDMKRGGAPGMGVRYHSKAYPTVA